MIRQDDTKCLFLLSIVKLVSNHNVRHEVMEAKKKGEGNSIERLSETDDLHYFYSTRLGKGEAYKSFNKYRLKAIEKKEESLLLPRNCSFKKFLQFLVIYFL